MAASERAAENFNQSVFDDAVNNAIVLVNRELPRATDMSLVRRIISDRVSENMRLGEHDRSRLAKAAIAHVRQELQVKASKERITRNRGMGSFNQPGIARDKE